RSERQMARELVDAKEFLEIFVDTPLEICEARDPKGLYRKARAGELQNFTGIDSPYEEPENPDLVLNGALEAPDTMADQIIEELRRRGII
ncbi:MAG TPA: adenylyl-sulfate kinase, partial [Kiloniellales bacterium]|nr:adenylyl-sulfate kinase [Kiloniellales bacterium]